MRKLLQLVSVLFVPATLVAQSEQIHLRLLNGKTGKPVPFQRILFFGSLTTDPGKRMATNFAVTTDDQGFASVTIETKTTRWLQVFPDFMTGCTPDPNGHFYSVSEIIATGVSAPNDCSKTVTQPTRPRTFTFFLRKPTLREQMDW